MVEMIRQGQTEEALSFAQDVLAPLVRESKTLGVQPEFVHDMEQTMMLLVFHGNCALPSKLSALLDVSRRDTLASQVNTAILSSQCQSTGLSCVWFILFFST
jgi:hypothetical protein